MLWAIMRGRRLLCVPVASGNQKFYDSDVKTVNIENKTNQTMECPDITLLFLFIKELVYFTNQ